MVTHRQRPATASGTTFINLEDETGLVNVICSKGCWTRYRVVARSSPALLIRGHLEASEGVVNVIADKIEPLPIDGPADPSTPARIAYEDGPIAAAGTQFGNGVPVARTIGSALRSRDFR